MIDFRVDAARCTRCGACVRDCPVKIITLPKDAPPAIAPQQEAACFQCQHCLAVCPTAAISILGRDPKASRPLTPSAFPSAAQMETLSRGRRSVRQYHNENVAPDLIRALLLAASHAPTGVNHRGLTFSVVDDKDAMHRLRVKTYALLEAAAAAGRIPENVELMRRAAPEWKSRGVDLVYRGAPHLLIVATDPATACPHEDVAIALANFEMLAVCAGLGTVWCGFFKMLAELLPDLKREVGLPPDHTYYALLFGWPLVRYARTVQRDADARIRRLTLT
jgi:nitroreductase/NAD-dependent dihydropyrimidine dehydrogenase PreA subunit